MRVREGGIYQWDLREGVWRSRVVTYWQVCCDELCVDRNKLLESQDRSEGWRSDDSFTVFGRCRFQGAKFKEFVGHFLEGLVLAQIVFGILQKMYYLFIYVIQIIQVNFYERLLRRDVSASTPPASLNTPHTFQTRTFFRRRGKDLGNHTPVQNTFRQTNRHLVGRLNHWLSNIK